MTLSFILEKVYKTSLNQKIVFWIFFIILLVIPFKVNTYNYRPLDDANRHVAKVISGKTWPEILVMDQTYQGLDHNGGWHAILAVMHQWGMDSEMLLLFSVIGLFLFLMYVGLFSFQHNPLAWVIAVLVAFSFLSPNRLFLGRPFIFSSAVFLLLLHVWSRGESKNVSRILISILCISLSAWVHGAWYLFAFLPVCLFLAQKFKEAVIATITWLAASIIAGLLTGHPGLFLWGQVRQTLASVGTAPRLRLLVGEFQPSYDSRVIIVIVLIMFAYHFSKIGIARVYHSPAFWGTVLGWVLGISNGRFWLDWGLVSFIYFVASSLDDFLTKTPVKFKAVTLSHVGLISLAVYSIFTVDIASRWSNQDLIDPLRLDDPEHIGWLPEPGGIFYSDSMRLYYATFFENPHGEWRYMLGHEPALMPEEDLAVFRDIQFYRHQGEHLFQPWVDKMTSKDRLVLSRSRSAKPGISDLEWKYVAHNTWVGRLPR